MIKVTNEIQTYDQKLEESSKVVIRSHWTQKCKVELIVEADGEVLCVTVVAGDLIKAINNATNTK